MTLDLHKKPFDEGTKVKLSLYKNYIQEWLPVFLGSKPKFNRVNIFDFFCGPGKDEEGQNGSPLITLELLDQYLENIRKNNITVSLFFNDNIKRKIERLKTNISNRYVEGVPYEIEYSSEEFEKLFNHHVDLMSDRHSSNFLFLDQSGVKHITSDVFKRIVNIPTTDFLFFISSSTLNRFDDNPDIKKYISIPSSVLSASNYCHIHRCVLEYYRDLIPKHKKYYLCPFSIKKGANIYGLIFGTGHLLGIEKFVNQCWKIDPQTGDSNFDIDKDNIDEFQPSLFPELDKPKKVQGFEKELKDAIMNRKLATNIDIYKFTLFNGFKAEHAKRVVAKMMTDNGLPRQKINISYNACKHSNAAQQIKYG